MKLFINEKRKKEDKKESKKKKQLFIVVVIFFFGGGLALLDGYSGDRIGSISKRINLLPKSLKKRKKKTTINKLRLKFNNGNK